MQLAFSHAALCARAWIPVASVEFRSILTANKNRKKAARSLFIRHYLSSVDTIVLLFHSNSNSLCSNRRSKCDFIAANANATVSNRSNGFIVAAVTGTRTHRCQQWTIFAAIIFYSPNNGVLQHFRYSNGARTLRYSSSFFFFRFLPENKRNWIVGHCFVALFLPFGIRYGLQSERQTLNCERVENSMVVVALEIITLITNAFGLTLTFLASPKFYFLLCYTLVRPSAPLTYFYSNRRLFCVRSQF